MMKLIRVVTITMGLLILNVMNARIVFAQEPLPVWWENLRESCIQQNQTRRGVEYCTGEIKTNLGETRTVHVIVVDLYESGVKIEYVIAWGLNKYATPDAQCNQACSNDQPHECRQISECRDVNRSTKTGVALNNRPGCDDPCNRNYYPVMSLEQALNRARRINPNVAVVIDSDYGAYKTNTRYNRDHGPEGLTVVRGIRLDGRAFGDEDNNAEQRPWLAVSETSPLNAMIGKLESGTDIGRKPDDWIYTGVGGAPRLIQDGVVVEEEINTCFRADPASCRPGASQVAVGLSEGTNPRWLFLVLAEKPSNNRDQLLLPLANFMKDKLGAKDAIKLDGGGSSQLWYEGYPEKNGVVYREEQRMLSQYLAVIAQPGEGIQLRVGPAPEPAPEPTPPPQPGKLERLLEWLRGIAQEITQAWQVLQHLIQEIARLLAETRQNVEELLQFLRNIQNPEWWVEQLEHWLVQCCGSIFLPMGAALMVRAAKKHRR